MKPALKICGMKDPGNIGEIAALSPDYMGFIHYERSPRHMEGRLPEIPSSVKKVGVFVDAEAEYILDQSRIKNLDLIQLHGDESPEYCKKLKEVLKSSLGKTLPLIKVFSVGRHFDFKVLSPYELVVDIFLFDTKGEYPGGNGVEFDWELLKEYPSDKPYFLSGGIGNENLDKLKTFFNSPISEKCMAVDVNSRFEIRPGLKNPYALEKFKTELELLNTKRP
ncbi:phosphoribosylanthranilate isomerase [Robertkochia aurantiaca]|uniref:phosphoribosylanthranilate isomerase n=1 Tax=Robertkochia aurantiaca TaxID=2873700 RepID=UPI001CCE86AA|nr:phosphoribosylanthranilate isomerase [Robertkochia sp. 3YJGBD-33]